MITHLIAMYNVFSVHWEIFSTSGGGGGGGGRGKGEGGRGKGDTMGTSGKYLYLVHRGMLSTSGGYHNSCGGAS